MCTGLHSSCVFIFDKILKYCKNIQKVCRVIALLDALLGLIILVILLIRRLRSASEYTESTVSNLLILGLQTFEIASAIVLYEGVRREVICMIKLWFCYCVTRLVVLATTLTTIYPNLLSSSRSRIRLWLYGFEVSFTLFHVIQCICLLVLRHQSKSLAAAEANVNKICDTRANMEAILLEQQLEAEPECSKSRTPEATINCEKNVQD